MGWLPRRKRKDPTRLSQDDWAQMLANYFSFNGNSYPITGFTYAGSNKESVPNDFESYTLQAFKGDSIVFSSMWARALLFSEMRFTYQHLDDGRPGDYYYDPALQLLEKPWPNGTTGEMLIRALQDTDLAGNFYLVKEVDPKTRVARVRRLRPDWVDIVLTAPPDKARKSDVAGYIYKPGNSPNSDDWETFPIDGTKGAIAHWSPIPDPEAQYRGMSPLTPILNEILVDKGATNHKKKFFEQGATPQLAVSFKSPEDLGMTPEQFQDFVREMRLNTEGVSNAYSTMYLAGGADVTVVGSHLQQLDFRNMQGHLETRLAAALRIHPVLVGLAEAIHGSPLAIGNYQAAKDMFGEMWLRPMWRSLCDSLRCLVPEYEGSRLWYDDRDVSFLRQDRQAQSDLMNQNAQTMNFLIMAGYTPESAQQYIWAEGDPRVLQHSGLVSVQMQPVDQAADGGGGSGKVSPAARPVPPIPPEKAQGDKEVTPVPKPPKQTKEPKVPKPGSNSYLNKSPQTKP